MCVETCAIRIAYMRAVALRVGLKSGGQKTVGT